MKHTRDMMPIATQHFATSPKLAQLFEFPERRPSQAFPRSGSSRSARFSQGVLPVEYLPLNRETLHSGDYFGPLPFQITPSSHAHHFSYLEAAAKDEELTPFEMWPCARTLSQWKFGRINEVISLEAKRRLFGRGKVGDELWAETLAERVSLLRGICIAKFTSRTWSSSGKLLMESEDTLLLTNGSAKASLREVIRKSTSVDAAKPLIDVNNPLNTWTLKMRFPWPEDLWLNNVHTRSYATALGFEYPLVEGPAVADRVWWHLFGRAGTDSSFPKLIQWKYRGPLYEGVRVNLLQVAEDPKLSDTIVFQPSIDEPRKGRVLMNIRISRL